MSITNISKFSAGTSIISFTLVTAPSPISTPQGKNNTHRISSMKTNIYHLPSGDFVDLHGLCSTSRGHNILAIFSCISGSFDLGHLNLQRSVSQTWFLSSPKLQPSRLTTIIQPFFFIQYFLFFIIYSPKFFSQSTFFIVIPFIVSKRKRSNNLNNSRVLMLY
jgi:hypothetical protein